MSAELSASLAPVLGQRAQQRGRTGSAGVTHGLLHTWGEHSPIQTSPHSLIQP